MVRSIGSGSYHQARGASTEVSDGVDLSELYIIDNNVGDVMTESFLTCEANATSVEASAVEQLAEQAAAQGITYIVAGGDTGSAGCDDLSETQATGPLSVNLLAATPFNVAVGGTQFNEHGSNSLYWSSTNNQYTLTSARSYIPEDVWNESCTVAQCGQQNANIAAGGGGASTFFAKPPWQSGVAGIPSDGMRDVPDVALTAAALHDPYLLCLEGSCVPNTQGYIYFYAVGGTSASAPAFAGMIALVNAAVVGLNSHPRLGQINPVLYGLASKETFSSCNGSSILGLPASGCIFNDVTIGNNAVPGESGYGTSSANYLSGTGYDLATGLGSVNLANLVKNWNTSFDPTSTTLTISPTTFTHGTPVQVNIAVTSPSGTPTGQVALYTSSSLGLPVPGNSFTLDNTGGITTTMKTLPGGGLYTATAHYAGDGTFGWSDSSPVQLSVTPENSNTYLHLVTFDLNFNPIFTATTTPYGSPYLLREDVTNTIDAFQATPACSSGCPTGNVAVSANPPLVGGTFKLNSLGYTEDQAIQLSGGNYNLSANYQGDASFNASSGSLMVNISPAPTTVTAGIPTSVQYGVLQQITGAVKTTSNGVAPGGTFTFFDDGVQLSGISIGYCRSPYNPSMSPPYASLTGSGSFPFASLGPHSLTMQYTGDSNYAGGTSPAYAFTVVPASTYFVGYFANPNPTTPNLAVTLSSSIGTSSTLGPPTGTITYYDGTTVLGTATVAQPQLVHTFTDLGTHTITAQYSGDANFASSTMPPLILNVYNQLPTAIANLYTASNPPAYGIPTTVYALVQRTGSGGPAMSGTVSFTDNGAAMAGTVTYQYNTYTVLASLPVTYNALGNHTIVAQYSGDSNYAASQSQISFSVGAPFSLNGGGSFSMGRAGGSGTDYVTIFPDGNSTLPVNLSCASSSAKATCSVAPNSVTLNNGSISTVVVNYTVPALGAKLMSPRRLSLWAIAAGAIFGGAFLLFVPGSRRQRGITLVVLFIALTTGIVACGGGGAAGVPGPTSQIYTFTVTGTLATDNTVTASTTFTVTVQ